MQETLKIIIGIAFLVMGYPLGIFLARITKEELKDGRKWFRLIILFSLVGGTLGLIFKNDLLMFSFFFIAIITSRSLKK
jgi:hypothetical protein